MNNVVLQRLIHGYQLIDAKQFDDKFNAQDKPFISGEDGPFTPQQNFDMNHTMISIIQTSVMSSLKNGPRHLPYHHM